jgi:hypothetical protein
MRPKPCAGLPRRASDYQKRLKISEPVASPIAEISAEDIVAAHEAWHESAMETVHTAEDGKRRAHPSAVGRLLGIGKRRWTRSPSTRSCWPSEATSRRS